MHKMLQKGHIFKQINAIVSISARVNNSLPLSYLYNIYKTCNRLYTVSSYVILCDSLPFQDVYNICYYKYAVHPPTYTRIPMDNYISQSPMSY